MDVVRDPLRVLLVGAVTAVTVAGSAGSAVSATASAVALTPAQAAYARMTPAQRIGQLFTVGTPATGLTTAATTAVTRYHVGNLILTGRTTAGAPPVRAVTAAADALSTPTATAGVPLFIATDQEGGAVQVLQGPGFSRMPSALTQGTWADTTLRSYAASWGVQVRRAGVDVDLAPVMDTVPAATAATNAPIGYYAREFGHTPSVVADKGSTFVRGMRAAGLALTAKHFPGLGHVTANPDVSTGVRDTVTTSTSADLAPFRSAVGAGARLLMVSTAIYTRIDASRPAAFSPTVVTGLVRRGMGFTGVVVSDDLGQAAQVRAWTPGARAVDFIDAGGDLVLTVVPSVIPAMVAAVTTRAASDAAFGAKVQASVMRVLTLKAAEGLLAPRLVVDGVLGPRTVIALQVWLGVTATGRLDTATLRALQARIGATVDGSWGPRSMAALQSYLGIVRDGASTWNSRTVAALQRYLTTQL
jgi:beta-N-acetylhexosaminidase